MKDYLICLNPECNKKTKSLKHKYCSLKCNHRYLYLEKRKKGLVVPKFKRYSHCLWCKKPIKPPRRKYCSQKCGNLYLYRENDYLKVYYPRTYHKKICSNPNCKKEFETFRNNRKYCSKKCRCHCKFPKKKVCQSPKCNNVFYSHLSKKKYCCARCCYTAQYYRERDDKGIEERKRNIIRNFSNKTEIKDLFFAYKKNKCELCSSMKNLNIHHKKYTKNYKDWQLVCSSCHKNLHPNPNWVKS